MSELLVTLVTRMLFIAPVMPSSLLLLAGFLFYGYFRTWHGLTASFWLIVTALLAIG